MSIWGSLWSGKKEEEEEEEDVERGEKGEEREGEEKGTADAWTAGLGNFVRSVSNYANTIGDTVKSKVQEAPLKFVSEFQEEQEKFEREQRRQKDAAVPPWVGYHEEEQMKAQILELSADSRNVLRNPPPGVNFQFDFVKSSPVAMATLKEDPRLQKLRFELVPKKVREETFWHNYFYRVFLIKQSSQLATLSSAEQRVTSSDCHDDTEGKKEEGDRGKVEGEGEGEGGRVQLAGSYTVETEIQSPTTEEFASDALAPVGGEINRESMKKELVQLGVSATPGKGKAEEERWEEQLQAELHDLEMQGLDLGGEGGEEVDVGEGEGDEEAWEAELQQMLDMHSEQKQD